MERKSEKLMPVIQVSKLTQKMFEQHKNIVVSIGRPVALYRSRDNASGSGIIVEFAGHYYRILDPSHPNGVKTEKYLKGVKEYISRRS